MSIHVTVVINKCPDCRHCGHSGSFTTGGAKPICDHPKVFRYVEGDDGWECRVIPYSATENGRVPKRIPAWCPLRHGENY